MTVTEGKLVNILICSWNHLTSCNHDVPEYIKKIPEKKMTNCSPLDDKTQFIKMPRAALTDVANRLVETKAILRGDICRQSGMLILFDPSDHSLAIMNGLDPNFFVEGGLWKGCLVTLDYGNLCIEIQELASDLKGRRVRVNVPFLTHFFRNQVISSNRNFEWLDEDTILVVTEKDDLVAINLKAVMANYDSRIISSHPLSPPEIKFTGTTLATCARIQQMTLKNNVLWAVMYTGIVEAYNLHFIKKPPSDSLEFGDFLPQLTLKYRVKLRMPEPGKNYHFTCIAASRKYVLIAASNCIKTKATGKVTYYNHIKLCLMGNKFKGCSLQLPNSNQLEQKGFTFTYSEVASSIVLLDPPSSSYHFALCQLTIGILFLIGISRKKLSLVRILEHEYKSDYSIKAIYGKGFYFISLQQTDLSLKTLTL